MEKHDIDVDSIFSKALAVTCEKYYTHTNCMEKLTGRVEEEECEIVSEDRIVEKEISEEMLEKQWESIDQKNRLIRDLAVLNSLQAIIRIHLELLKMKQTKSAKENREQLSELMKRGERLLLVGTKEEILALDAEQKMLPMDSEESQTKSKTDDITARKLSTEDQQSIAKLLPELTSDDQANALASITSLEDVHSSVIARFPFKEQVADKEKEFTGKSMDELWKIAYDMCNHLEELAESVKLSVPISGSLCRNVMRKNLELLTKEVAAVTVQSWWATNKDRKVSPSTEDSETEKQPHGAFIRKRLFALLQDIEKEICAVMIQSWWRMKFEQKRYKELKEAKRQEEAATEMNLNKPLKSRKDYSKWTDDLLAERELIKVAGLSTNLQTTLYNINLCLQEISVLAQDALSRFPELIDDISQLFIGLEEDLAGLIIQYWWFTVQQKKHLMKFVNSKGRSLFGHVAGVQHRLNVLKHEVVAEEVPTTSNMSLVQSKEEKCKCPWEALESITDRNLEERERSAFLIQKWWRHREGMELLFMNKDLLSKYDVIVRTYKERFHMLMESKPLSKLQVTEDLQVQELPCDEQKLADEIIIYVEPCFTFALQDLNIIPGKSVIQCSTEQELLYTEEKVTLLEDDTTTTSKKPAEQEYIKEVESAPSDAFGVIHTLDLLAPHRLKPASRKYYKDFLINLKRHFAAIRIQVWWYLAKSQKSKTNDLHKVAIFKVFFYLYILRKRLIALQNYLNREIAAITIQAWWRVVTQNKIFNVSPQDVLSVVKDIVACGLYCKSALAELTDEREALTNAVHSTWKYKAKSCEYFEGIMKLQAACRGYLARKSFEKISNEKQARMS